MQHRSKSPGNGYCAFHEDHGHDTEECRDLMHDIDALVKDGTLKRYKFDDSREAPPQGNKKRKHSGRGRRCADTEKKPKPDHEEEDDDAMQFDGTVDAITGLPLETTRSALRTEARRPPTEEPTNKRLRKDEVIIFSDADPVPPSVPHQDAILIQAGIANKIVHSVHVDTGASVSILFKDCCDRLDLSDTRLTPSPLPLRSFTQEETHPEGLITLPVTVGQAPTSSTAMIQFFVVKAASPYNAILGRDWLNKVRAVCSTYHLTVNIPTRAGIAVVQGDQRKAKECLHVALRGAEAPPQHPQA